MHTVFVVGCKRSVSKSVIVADHVVNVAESGIVPVTRHHDLGIGIFFQLLVNEFLQDLQLLQTLVLTKLLESVVAVFTVYGSLLQVGIDGNDDLSVHVEYTVGGVAGKLIEQTVAAVLAFHHLIGLVVDVIGKRLS